MKRKLIKGFAALVVVLVVVVVGLVGYVKANANPTFEISNTGITASDDPAIIARGEYLFHGPMHCTACHVKDWETWSATTAGDRVDPIGGQEWVMGPLGTMRAPNLTSDKETGAGQYTDEHIARVIKHGVGEDGKLRVFMAIATPTVPDADVQALLSYVRTIPPQKQVVPPDELGLMGDALVVFGMFAPKHLPGPKAVVLAGEEPTVARGEYLATGPAMCAQCHSPYNPFDGMKLQGERFSGCFQPDPAKDSEVLELCAPNLTPDPTTGHMRGWDETQFVARIRAGIASPNSIMPWGNYATMTEVDLRSIYMYLKSLPPVVRDTGPGIREKGTFTPPES